MPRVLCWIMCEPGDSKLEHLNNTWLPHCDVALLLGTYKAPKRNVIGLNTTAGRGHISAKAKAAWQYIYKHHIDDADYFVKGDPDTFIVVENLKAYLADRDPDTCEMFGHRLRLVKGSPFPPHMIGTVYNSGGPGEVLSRSAVKTLVTKVLADEALSSKCWPDGKGEDIKVCYCLKYMNCYPQNTLDEFGRETFMVFPPRSYLFPNKGRFVEWYYRYDLHNGTIFGKNCCSENPIGFHYIKDIEMYQLYYLFYQVNKVPSQRTAPLSFIGNDDA